jgi:PAS domain S-box-containing protein
MTMNTNQSIFKTRFGRRLLLIFSCCALLPMFTLSLVAFNQVSSQLKQQSHQQLRQAVKTHALSIYDRLCFLEAQLQFLATELTHPHETDIARPVQGLHEHLRDRFLSIGVQTDTVYRALYGPAPADPKAIDPAVKARLRNATTTIIVKNLADGRGCAIQIIRQMDPVHPENGVLLGTVSPAYLWGIGQFNALPPGTQLCVFDALGNLLVNVTEFPSMSLYGSILKERDPTGKVVKFSHAGEIYYVSAWNLFLKAGFDISDWKIVFFQSRETALAPMAQFKYTFALVTLLSFWIVLLFSIRHIRKSLIPLNHLKEAAGRLGTGEFNYQVQVFQDDEFGEVACAFNRMTRQLERQFRALDTIARIGRKAASVFDVPTLMNLVVRQMQSRLDFKKGMILIFAEDRSRLYCAAHYGFSEQQATQISTWQIDLVKAQLDPDTLFDNLTPDSGTCMPLHAEAESHPLNQDLLQLLGFKSALCAPISYERKQLGLLVLDNNDTQDHLTTSEASLLAGIAAQIASAFFNAIAFKELARSEAQFKSAFAYAATGMALVQVDGRFLELNPKLEEILGYEEEILRNMRLDEVVHAEDRHNCTTLFNRLAKNQSRSIVMEARFVAKDGNDVWCLVSASLLRAESGRPVHYIVHFLDLTQQRHAEQEQEKLLAQLRQVQKMEAIGTLAGGIAHDFNNILSGIMGYAQLAQLKSSGNADVDKHVQNILDASQRARDLVSQILTFSRQDQQSKLPIKVSTPTKEALKLLRASIPANIEISCQIVQDDLPVLASPIHIHQIVMNLCTNAYQSMCKAGGQLQVSVDTVRIDRDNPGHAGSLPPGYYTRLEVVDNGCGIPQGMLERIFEPYFTTKEKNKGTGLGLAVVHGIVKSCNGDIHVDSQVDQGSRFTVLLPQMDPQKTEAEAAIPVAIGGTERILFVDDESAVLDIARQMMAHLGYQVSCCNNPLDALEQFRQAPKEFDLLITDLSMPNMTGDTLAKAILKLRPDMPVVLCSGFSDSLRDGNVRKIGIKKILAKPFTFQSLDHCIRTTLKAPVAVT